MRYSLSTIEGAIEWAHGSEDGIGSADEAPLMLELATLRRKAALADLVITAAGCGVPVDWPLVIARWHASFAAGAG